MKLTIHFDGGCKPTNPGNMYGSYSVILNDIELVRSTEEFGHGTNNVAEFRALLHGVLWTLDYLEMHNEPSVFIDLEIFTDSMILRNRLMNRDYQPCKKFRNTDGAKRMKQCTDELFPLLDKFKSFEVKWHGRDNNVERFGH